MTYSRPREPIAIVGIGCSFPGANTHPEGLYDFLIEGRSAIVPVPEDRWDREAFYHPDPTKPGFMHVRRGGFLDAIDRFDPAFFGLSPHEARRMDPQQRLALETSFRAIEDAGMPLDRLAGTDTAVVLGLSGHDQDVMQGRSSERHLIRGTSNTGGAASVAANRVSFLFDLRGPSLAVDTACSSALYAVHLVCRAIWSGEAEMGLAGGVNLIFSPGTTIGFSTGGYLSPDEECRAFSDHANGYVRGEGAGMVFLKPLSKARADGDRIYAAIRSTWVNQDGRSLGMTSPSEDAQVAMLEAAYRVAEVEPALVAYVEAHGTGTPVGDPIEARSIGRVLGASRQGALPLGSVKTNLGHLESAAGAAGLIKLALTLQRRVVPPNLNFRAPNPAIPFDELRLMVPTKPVALAAEGPLYGGVNSFGFGGANAHLVLEAPPAARLCPEPAETAPVLTLSAQTPVALRTMAGELADILGTAPGPVSDVATGLRYRRSRFEHRVSIPAGGDAVARLRALADGASPVSLRRVHARHDTRLVFVFGGQGPQWWGMGRELMARPGPFRRTVERVDEVLRGLGWLKEERSHLLAEMGKREATSRLHETEIAQPALFALQMGLAAHLAHDGVRPDAVVGHSIGELAAAATAGALSFEEATRLVFWRSRAQALAENKGAMLAVGLSEHAVAPYLERFEGRIEIAAFNGPGALTLAGDHDAIRAVGADLEADEVFVRRLAVSVPFHCFLMDPVEAPFREGLGSVAATPTGIPFYSTVTGQRTHGEALDLAYWFRNIRQPVRFEQALRALAADGYRIFTELGPHPILQRGAEATVSDEDTVYVPTLRRPRDGSHGEDAEALAQAVASLWSAGALDAADRRSPLPPHAAKLPRYELADAPIWLESDEGRRDRTSRSTHPVVRSVDATHGRPEVFRADLDFNATVETYLGEHVVQGMVVVPAAAQLEAITAAAQQALPELELFLESVCFHRALVLPDGAAGDPDLETRLEVWSDEGHFTLSSRPYGSESWTEHTTGRINHSGDRYEPSPPRWTAEARARFTTTLDVGTLFREAAAAGLELGASFQGIRHFERDETATLARIEAPASLAHDERRYTMHPAILDSVIQTAAFGPLSRDSEARGEVGLFLPHRVGRFRILGRPEGPFECHAKVVEERGADLILDVRATAPDGQLLVAADGFVVRYIEGSRQADSSPLDRVSYEERFELEEERAETPVEHGGSVWCVLGDARSAAVIIQGFEQRGVRSLLAVTAAELRALAADAGELSGVVVCAPRGVDAALLAEIAGLVPALVERHGALSVAFVTRRAWVVDEADVEGDTSGALLWGLGRVIEAEEPRAEVLLVDCDDASDEALVSELLSKAPDYEVALRGGRRHVRRLRRAAPSVPTTVSARSGQDAVRAEVASRGVVSSVELRRCDKPAPPPGKVRIAVRAAALNFKDVVVAMEMLDDRAWTGGLSGATLGMECAGVIDAVGPGVDAFRVGDEVVALAPEALATYAIADHRLTVPKPPQLSFADAAALPTVFLTAEIALGEAARLREGETVLIHSAAGGVGSAAVQVARRLGARVYGTTSTPEKEAWARSLGAERLFYSRSSSFREEVLAATDGRGVDVVLNSLSGRSLSQGIRALAPFGRFVEIGKADIYANRQIGLEQFGENRSFHVVDINRWAAAFPDRTQALMRRILERVASGQDRPLPVERFSFPEAADAMVHLARGKHRGKVVVEVEPNAAFEARAGARPVLRDDEAYLVTGGTGGFGLAVAERLAELGAGHLFLVSRRGSVALEDQAQLDAIRRHGATVTLHAGDMGDRDAVAGALSRARQIAPLGGIVHCAMVLDDGPLSTLDVDRIGRVLHPKAEGARWLDELSRGDDLELFVMFSSIASVLGTPGQASYAAANAYLDALAHRRRAAGLAGTTINWGVLLGTGVVQRASETQRARILSQGVGAFGRDEALGLFEEALRSGVIQRLVADIDWERVGLLRGSQGRPSRFHVDEGTTDRAVEESDLRGLPPEERSRAIAARILDVVARLSGESREALDPETGLDRLGLDSLMGTQLRASIEASFGVEVPLVRLLKGPTARELGETIAAHFEPEAAPKPKRHQWLRPLRQVTSPRQRIFVLPAMADDGDSFQSWVSRLPSGVELWAVERPELGGDLDALLRGPVEALRRAMVSAVVPKTDLPFVLYGHSMGGWIALDLAEALREERASPRAVVLGALPTNEVMQESLPDRPRDPEAITDEHLARVINGFAVPTPEDPRLRERLHHRLRRDLWLGVQSGRFNPGATTRPPDVPVWLFGGEQDPVPTVDEAAVAHVDGVSPVHVERVAGGHAFALQGRGAETVVGALVELARSRTETVRPPPPQEQAS